VDEPTSYRIVELPLLALAKLSPGFYPAPNSQIRPFTTFIIRVWDSWPEKNVKIVSSFVLIRV